MHCHHRHDPEYFGFYPQCTMCMSTRLANYPCGEKDNGQSKVTMGDETSACMNSAHTISYHRFPHVCRILCMCFSLCFIISVLVTDDVLALKKENWILSRRKTVRETLLSFSCWVSGEKIDKWPQIDGVWKTALAKTAFNLHTCSAGCRIQHCLCSLIIYSAWDGPYISLCLSLTSVMEVISLAVTFCFSVVLLDFLSIFN